MKHLKNFNNIVEVIEHSRGDIFADAGLIKHETEKGAKEGINGVTGKEYARRVRER